MSAQVIPMDDGYQDAAELNALREQEAREAWALVRAVTAVAVRTGLIREPSAIEGLARAVQTVENELGFSPKRSHWDN